VLSVVCIFFFIADSWPMVFDDRRAREDWGWRHEYDLDGLVKVMFQYLAPKFGKTLPDLDSVATRVATM